MLSVSSYSNSPRPLRADPWCREGGFTPTPPSQSYPRHTCVAPAAEFNALPVVLQLHGVAAVWPLFHEQEQVAHILAAPQLANHDGWDARLATVGVSDSSGDQVSPHVPYEPLSSAGHRRRAAALNDEAGSVANELLGVGGLDPITYPYPAVAGVVLEGSVRTVLKPTKHGLSTPDPGAFAPHAGREAFP